MSDSFSRSCRGASISCSVHHLIHPHHLVFTSRVFLLAHCLAPPYLFLQTKHLDKTRQLPPLPQIALCLLIKIQMFMSLLIMLWPQ